MRQRHRHGSHQLFPGDHLNRVPGKIYSGTVNLTGKFYRSLELRSLVATPVFLKVSSVSAHPRLFFGHGMNSAEFYMNIFRSRVPSMLILVFIKRFFGLGIQDAGATLK